MKCGHIFYWATKKSAQTRIMATNFETPKKKLRSRLPVSKPKSVPKKNSERVLGSPSFEPITIGSTYSSPLDDHARYIPSYKKSTSLSNFQQPVSFNIQSFTPPKFKREYNLVSLPIPEEKSPKTPIDLRKVSPSIEDFAMAESCFSLPSGSPKKKRKSTVSDEEFLSLEHEVTILSSTRSFSSGMNYTDFL